MRRYDSPATRCGDLERLAEQASGGHELGSSSSPS